MSLAVAEKRPQRAGGCVGIFFQLFSKRKLFSKKLLPPVRSVRKAAKKLGGDDRMPMSKLLLIADENRGGFPKLDPEPNPFTSLDDHGSEMQTPGLVARLMGLESMPVVHHEKPRKALDSKVYNDRSFEHSRLDQELCLDSGGNGKIELRPQKLQKTTQGGFLERKPAELFHKAVVSGSKKKQYFKLGSPVKSPRLLSRANTARLVQVANRILEPGLQRAKCAITYMESLEEDERRFNEPLNDFLVGSFSSCSSSVVKDNLVSGHGSSSSDLSNGSEAIGMKSSVFPSGQPRNGSLAVQTRLNVESRAHDLMGRKQLLGSDRNHCKLQQDLTLKPALRKNNMKPNQLSSSRDNEVFESKVYCRKQMRRDPNEFNGAKDFVAMNKNLNNCTRMRSVTKLSGGHKVEIDKNGWEKNMGRKRRPQIANVGAINISTAKEKTVGSGMIQTKGTEVAANRAIRQSCNRSDLKKKLNGDSFHKSEDNGIVSFTFNSPMRHDRRPLADEEMAEKRRGHGEFARDAGQARKLVLDEKSGNLSSLKEPALRGDELSNLLEEKIRELTSLDDDELATGDALPGRSTASILEELISALTAGTMKSLRNDGACLDASTPADVTITQNPMTDIIEESQGEAQAGIFVSCMASDNNQPSPISVLEASFSNDSWSGSLNGSSGAKPYSGLAEVCNKAHPSDLDADLLDSATSLNDSDFINEKIPCSTDRTSSSCDYGVPETELGNATEVISDMELLFENIPLYGSHETLGTSFDPFPIGTLETIIDAFCANPRCSLSSKQAEETQLRELLLDCMMECLDLKYSNFCRSGFRTWQKLSLALNRDRLRRETLEEITGWSDLAGKTPDGLIEKELNRSSDKWTECDTEAFEAGVDIESDILRALVDEMVIELC